jgi:hypothetical protein
VAGRSARGERGQFERLEVNIRASINGIAAFREEVVIDPSEMSDPALMPPGQALVTVLALGAWPDFLGSPVGHGGLVGSSSLRSGGILVRGIFPNLGAALGFLSSIERVARMPDLLTNCPSAGRSVQAIPC